MPAHRNENDGREMLEGFEIRGKRRRSSSGVEFGQIEQRLE
jgi:hypothetical protein